MPYGSRLKQWVKKVPGAFWLVGALRYTKFFCQLRMADIDYQRSEKKDVPPPMLRYRVHRALDRASYERNGAYLSSLLCKQIQEFIDINDGTRILDFACGPGRVIVKLKDALRIGELYGSDIDHEAIAWASSNLEHVASFTRNDIIPPTDFSDEYFDVIYSISLFTHLDERLQNEWLQELMRLVKPGGILITTVHGAFCTKHCTAEEVAMLQEVGIVFRVDHVGLFKLDGLPDFYQTTFHTKEYVIREWEKFGTVEKYLEGGVDNHQDLIVLRKH